MALIFGSDLPSRQTPVIRRTQDGKIPFANEHFQTVITFDLIFYFSFFRIGKSGDIEFISERSERSNIRAVESGVMRPT